jgi:glutaredoxin-like protein NrdH
MEVIVYTLPDCVQCDMTKKYLAKNDVEYKTVDLSEDKEASEEIAKLNYKQAPVVTYGTFHWSGFRPDKIKALHLLLNKHGMA